MEVIEIARLMRRGPNVSRDVNERTLDIVLIFVFAERARRAKIKNLAETSFVHVKLSVMSHAKSVIHVLLMLPLWRIDSVLLK